MHRPPASASSFEDWQGVHDAVAEAYFPHAMRALSRGPAGTSEVGVVDLGPCRVTRMTLGATVRVTTDHPGAFAVNTALSGHLEHRVAGRSVVSDEQWATICPPDTSMQLPAWDSSCTLLGFRVEEEFMAREHERVLARRVVPLPARLDLRTPAGHQWVSWVRVVVDQASSVPGGLHADPLMRRRMSEMLVAGLLLAATPDDEAPRVGTRPRVVRRAMSAMEEDPARAWSPGDLAALAGVSVRRLQQGFREYVGMTPFQYLHDLRLERAHQDLVHAEARVGVTEVAMRWGLTHTGRFAADYRAKFGQSPSQTLRG
ncbi:AraC family transcriptional regulator [Oryzobacter terrae]|uniref:AraC family transcriptional regulator n=1 Tax=Oryzobacter terrae TaxID=1620385 RepID=UPI0036724801